MRALGFQLLGAPYFLQYQFIGWLNYCKAIAPSATGEPGREVLNFNVELMFCVSPHRVSFGGG